MAKIRDSGLMMASGFFEWMRATEYTPGANNIVYVTMAVWSVLVSFITLDKWFNRNQGPPVIDVEYRVVAREDEHLLTDGGKVEYKAIG